MGRKMLRISVIAGVFITALGTSTVAQAKIPDELTPGNFKLVVDGAAFSGEYVMHPEGWHNGGLDYWGEVIDRKPAGRRVFVNASVDQGPFSPRIYAKAENGRATRVEQSLVPKKGSTFVKQALIRVCVDKGRETVPTCIDTGWLHRR